MKNWNAIIEGIKTIKNYTLPLIGMGLGFMQTNCNMEANVLGAITLGAVIAYVQSTILKNTNVEDAVNKIIKK